jgi:flagellar motor switch protein FliN/FliY
MMENTSDQINLTEMEADIIGEVMNISMGAAATAMSDILDRKVNITTPRLRIVKLGEFSYTHLEPVLGVLIKYVEGIGGINMLLLKVEDFKKILSHLLSIDVNEITEFDEISTSAIGEIMNQMMGSASSALASFLGIKISISPPEILDTTDSTEIQEKLSALGEDIILIGFDINIEGLVKSEFVSIMDPLLAREIIRMSLGEEQVTQRTAQILKTEESMTVPEPFSPQEIETAISAAPPAQPVFQTPPVPPIPPAPAVESMPRVPKPQVQATPYTYPQLAPDDAADSGPGDRNLELILSVPVQITVELGKTKRKIKEIAEFAPGNIIELDRQAGDQVDIMANGRLIARGDVVVVDDNYSVRITEIMRARDNIADSK